MEKAWTRPGVSLSQVAWNTPCFYALPSSPITPEHKQPSKGKPKSVPPKAHNKFCFHCSPWAEANAKICISLKSWDNKYSAKFDLNPIPRRLVSSKSWCTTLKAESVKKQAYYMSCSMLQYLHIVFIASMGKIVKLNLKKWSACEAQLLTAACSHSTTLLTLGKCVFKLI